MLYFIEKRDECTGCSACYAICPVSCIKMTRDEEGFVYPVASDECIKCGKCEKICPSINPPKVNNRVVQKGYAAVSKNEDIWRRSASGGAFSEICRVWGDEETLFVGAAWDGFDVRHIGIKGYDNILPLCKSKYIASEQEEVFEEIKHHLHKGRKAVFSGTPCQVAGLRKFLGKDCDELLLIDFICHGVGSPKVFKSCIDKIERQIGSEIKKYQFRAKQRCFDTDYITAVETEKQRIYLMNDPYMQLFLKQDCLRPSCGEHCKYRDEKRMGDITIADFKGLSHVFEELILSKKNYSTIIFNTDKGKSLEKLLSDKMIMLECSIDDIKQYNPLFYRQTWFSSNRNAFFNDFISSPCEAIEKWTKPAVKYNKSLKRRLYDSLPDKFRIMVYKLRQKVRR